MEIPWRMGVLKAKILEAKYEAKLEFLGGEGVQNKDPSMGGVWIFSGSVHIFFTGNFTFTEHARREGLRSASSIARDISTTANRWRICNNKEWDVVKWA